ncbi:MAG: dephospho-CoA kinase [Wenzhouxiangellaceae bacterium]
MNDPAPHDSDPASRRVPVIALTGGIASGKTAVSNAFAARGAPVVDTDVIAREVVAPGSDGLAQVRAEFGDGVITADGALGRAALRRLIFADDGARSRLETILHPLIEGEARARLSRIEAPYAILVVPLLVESGLFGDADRVLVVDVPESVQIERLTARDGVDRTQAESALAAQVSREQRLRHADDVIDNSGSLEALKRRVAELDRDYRQLGDSNDSEPA